WRAVDALGLRPNLVLVDGRQLPGWDYPSIAVIQGDSKVPQIAAASIVAKVARDRYMCEQHERWPVYGFAAHKGYPTAAHLAALRIHGVSPLHRRSFAPVRAVIKGD
ncbi:MAG: ribonuclease HII, partial [Congregibacter sp.]|nr:ribonuclease HII [Congregibacter sp.]